MPEFRGEGSGRASQRAELARVGLATLGGLHARHYAPAPTQVTSLAPARRNFPEEAPPSDSGSRAASANLCPVG